MWLRFIWKRNRLLMMSCEKLWHDFEWKKINAQKTQRSKSLVSKALKCITFFKSFDKTTAFIKKALISKASTLKALILRAWY